MIIIPEQKQKIKPDLDDWTKDLDQNSIAKSLEAGVILPQLKPELNTVYSVILLDSEPLPKVFDSKFGKTYAIDVEYNGLKHSLILGISFRYQLFVEMQRKGMFHLSDLIGKVITFKKSIGNTKDMDNVELYSVQLP